MSKTLELRHICALCAVSVFFIITNAALAQTQVSLFDSFAGDYDYVVIGGSLRNSPNSGTGANACSLDATDSASLPTIPGGSSLVAAYLYWGGSGATPDTSVTLNGANVPADRVFTDTFVLGNTYNFFGGFADVTSQVALGSGQNFTFGGLAVTTGAPFCAVQAVVAGWSLFVVYENSVTEPLRVINVFDGFQIFRGGSITLNPSNFVIPALPDGRRTVVTWEGDVENSAALGGFSENLTFNGSPLIDALNPLSNQFNSTINATGTTTEFGVDIDQYDISALLSPGDTSATTVYSSGGDLVILTLEVIGVSNAETADLALTKTHSGDFVARQNNDYRIVVSNAGPSDEANPVTVTDVLPSGLTFVSAQGAGWSCAAAGQTVTCTNSAPLADGQTYPDLVLTVFADQTTVPSVTNTASVSSATFDNQASNNQDTDPTNVLDLDPTLVVLKTAQTVSDPINGTVNPKAIPGADVQYTIAVSNTGAGPVDGGSLIVTDALPANASLFVDDSGGAPVLFQDGTPSSNLSFDFDTDVGFSIAPGGGVPYTYTPVPNADGFDPLITGIEVRPRGIFEGTADVANAPQFELSFRVRVGK
ncbi:MAG: hypothetical protein AB8G17_20310 [Gammaproteobacteria bacterium]